MAVGIMTHITCRLTAKNRDQLRNPTLCNRVWATFTFLPLARPDAEAFQLFYNLVDNKLKAYSLL